MVTATMIQPKNPLCSICRTSSQDMMEVVSGAADTCSVFCIGCLRYIVTTFNDWEKAQ